MFSWFLTSVSRQRNGEKKVFSSNDAGSTGNQNWKKKYNDSCTQHKNSHSTQELTEIIDLNAQSKTTKRKHRRKYLYLKVGSFCR